VELLDLDSAGEASTGQLATVVITPYFPFRECMPVFRYDTRDVVRLLPEGPLTCELAAMPGTGPIVGKADGLLRVAGGVVTPRDLVEAVEALPARPWPARFDARLVAGRVQLRLPASALAGLDAADVSNHFTERGLDVSVSVVDDASGPRLRRLRSDLHELTFVSVPALEGAAHGSR
jgi:phenylacetate-CoA ligase